MIIESQNVSFENSVSNNQCLSFNYANNLFESKQIEFNENKFKTLKLKNSDDKYNNLAKLLSDECDFDIKCAIYNDDSILEFKDRKQFEGSILKQVNDAFEYINLFNKTKGKIKGLERIDTKDYPEFAIREALLNALIHRDYNYSGSILISLYDSHIEITSLGGLVKGLNMNDIYLGISETRNPNLCNIFYRLKYIESFGTGIGRILKSYENFSKKPIFINTDNVFKVILYNRNYKDNLKVNMSQEDKIVEYINKNNNITRVNVEKILNISTTRAKTILKKMTEIKVIKQIGVGRNISYILN